jgi:uncharacterized protein involved in high-affinity Fe2+ transport
MKMKKLLLAAAFVASVTACSAEVTSPEQATPAAARANEAPTSTQPDTTSQPKEVGVVGPGGG